MASRSTEDIHAAVRAAYSARAREVSAGAAESCCGDACCTDSRAGGVQSQFYAGADTQDLPETVVSYGCGNPVAIGTLRSGEIVLDLGSGAGLDCFLAARQVGPSGRVFGLDMTDDMLALAERNRAEVGTPNVEFRKGIMEQLPIDDATVNVIISNCVINLSPDKDAVFREAFRVLTPGGRLHVADVVLLRELAAAEQGDLELWAGCVSGALPQTDYLQRLAHAGFVDVTLTLIDEQSDKPWRSALIEAHKPGAAQRPARHIGAERIELVAAPGLETETGACCGTGADATTRCC